MTHLDPDPLTVEGPEPLPRVPRRRATAYVLLAWIVAGCVAGYVVARVWL